MVEIVISVATKIAEYLVAPVGRPFRYLWNYKTNLENLKEPVKKLERRIETVEDLIKVGEEPLPHVKDWQERANWIIPEALELIKEDNPEQANIQCCKGFSCPNLMNHYQLSKKAGKLKSDVVDLEQEAAKFKEVSYPTILEEPWPRSSKGYDAFESRTDILKNIIDALRDPDVNMVGIYGMGCIGKTTLAREVAREAKQHNLFDKIVFVEVSESPDIKNIQGVIADILGLHFKEETVLGRANRLCDQLKKEGKILLILDNIWKGIDLGEIGIPFKNDHKGLKILLTTRSHSVLTNDMDCQRNFQVLTLNEADAWSLFKDTAGTCVDYPNLQSIAVEVAKECGGMPLAIVTIAKALKNKEEYEWIHALKNLKSPSLESYERIMTKSVYTSIKMSYEYLDTTELKEIFLLCSRMGRTYDASIRDLFMYGLGLGFFKRSNTLEQAQCMVEDFVKKLKDNSLLLDAPIETRDSLRYGIPDGERFAMHDAICVVARLIACEKGNVCIVIDDVISCSWAKKNILKNCTSITLHNIGELPEDLKLVLPQLKFFYMKPKIPFSRITDDFFIDISSLLVLHLIEMNLSPLPTSLSHLVNLQTLCLDACKLGDIADIGKLEKLKILSFRGSEIKKLPEEMCKLTSIRLLDLTHCSTLEIIPPSVISCFTQLEAFYMYGTLIRWEDGGLNIVGKNASLDELKHLRDRLTTLEICIPNVKMSEGLFSPQLKRYKISIADNRISPPKNSRTLRVKLNTNDNADEVISQLKGIKQLELCADLKGDFTDSKQAVSLDALFSLESLSLEDWNLEKICNVPLAAESFCQLRTITVLRCDKLTNIFSFSIDRVLPKLQEIEVSSCKNIEEIFAIEREDDVNNIELIHEIQFSQLCSVTLRRLPQLKSFCHRVKTTSQLQLTSNTNDGEIISEDMIDIPKSLFNEKVVFPNLETLEISDISAEKIWHNQLPMMSSSFQNLNRLVVQRCHNLKELFSSSMVNSFVQLQFLVISECSLLKEVVFMEELREEERKDTQFPFLKEMSIRNCCNFKGFISNDKIGFPSLKAMTIKSCPKFKEFIFNDKVAVPNIEELTIHRMDNLEKIWHNQLVNESFSKLKSLEVYGCEKLLNVFPSNICGRLLSLESLGVSWCGSLEEIFDLRELSIYDSQIMISFANLQKLRVSECVSLKNLFSASILAKEGVVMEEAPARFLFPKLTSLVLDDLPELRSFYLGRHKVEGPVMKKLELSDCGIHDTDEEGQMQQASFFSLVEEIGFLSLKEMEITRCPKLKEFIFNDKVAVPNIEKLRISYMDNLEKIWLDQLVKDSFCKLKSLEVYECKKLLNVFPSNICGRLVSLKSLEVSMCVSLEEIFDLRKLCIYDSQIMLSFGSLQRLEVSLCPSLKNLFSASILAKERVVKEEAPARFLFPKLTSFKLEDLPELRSFYPGRHKVERPVLKTLQLVHCGIRDIDEEGQMQQPFFLSLVEQAFPCLEELSLDGEKVTMLWQGQFSESLFDRLKILQVWYDESTVLPFGFIQRCPNLEMLLLHGISYKEIFQHGEDQTQTKIKTLHLYYLKNLKYIWKQNSKLDLIIQNIEVLKVGWCHSLINLVPPPTSFQNPSTSFQNLASLEVKHCNSLINIGTSIVAKRLVQLTEMSISSCEKITEVIGNHGDVIEDEIIFRKLKSLILRDLPSLVGFCSWNFTLKFPSLETLTVQQCPNMKIFSQGALRTDNTLFPNLNRLELKDLPKLLGFCNFAGNSIKLPSLTQLWIDNCPNMETFIFDSIDTNMPASKENFNKDIQPFFDEKVVFPSLENMVISGMDNLKSIWHNQFLGDSFSFPKLKSVEVNDCQELKTIFPTCVCGSLLSLESLTVKSCGLVEEIFDLQGLNLKEKHSIEITTQLRELYVDHMSNLKHIWNEDPKGMLSYQKLQKVTVFLCPNLENLFPASVAKSLWNLVSLEVSDCGLLKEIIAKEAADRHLFPKLNSLQLQNLQQLRTFYTGQTVELSCLKRLGLHHCDNVKLFNSEFPGFYETIELEELQLSGKAITMEWLDQVPGHVFCSLKSLELNDHESTVLPLDFIQRFGCLEKFSLNSSSYEEIFSHGEVNERPQIKHLVLSRLFDLKQIWKQGLKIDPKFQNLEILEVRSCFNLINLMPSSTSFQNLRILQVWGCDGLKNLLTSSTAKSLVLLEELEVFDCKLMKEVVANDGAVTEEINFRRLKSLSLTYLQSLASFCSTKHTLNFPILESLVVNECPKMKIFSEGVTSTPIFHKLELNWEACEQSWEVGLNTILKQNMEKRGQGMRVGMEEPSSHPHFPIDIITSEV